MNELKVGLSEETLNNPQEAIQNLIEASNSIANATEKDFEAIKNTKWYKRLWKTITFSKDNQKVMANGISNLAKLQEIVMKALLMLSEQSVELADITRQNSEMIEQLCNKLLVSNEQQFAIITQLNRIKTGVEKPLYLDDLQWDTKIIIINAVVTIAEQMNIEDELARKYISLLLSTAGCTSADIQNNIDFECIENLKIKEAQLLYRLCMEYVYICTDDFECDIEIMDYINVNRRKATVIEEQICKFVKIAGKESLLNGFIEENYDFIDEEYILFEQDELEEIYENSENETNIKAENINFSELEEITLSSMLHVQRGEKISFENKIIYIDTNINCEGCIEIRNCIVVYNKSKGTITLSNGASFESINCSFLCKYSSEKPFIDGEGTNSLTSIKFGKCGFFDCNNFIDLTNVKDFGIFDCKMYNCCGFARVTYCDSITIDNIEVLQNELKWFNIPSDETNMFVLDGTTVDVRHVYVEESKGFREHIYKKQKMNEVNMRWDSSLNTLGYFYISQNMTISDSKFLNLHKVIQGHGKIKNCLFKNCSSVIDFCGIDDNACIIDNCVFDNCKEEGYKNIIDAFSGFIVSNCKFIENKGKICSTIVDGAKFNHCEFVGCSNEEENGYIPDVMIELNGTHCEVRKSIFDNVDAKYGFIIAGSAIHHHDRINVYVEDCDFINCASLRDSKKLIKEWDHYYGMFNKRKDAKVVEVKNSYGWQNVSSKIGEYDVNKYKGSKLQDVGSTPELEEFIPIIPEGYENIVRRE